MSFFQLLLRLSSVSVFTSAIVLLTSMILGRIMEPQHFGEYSFLQSILMILVNVSSMASSLAISVNMYSSKARKLNRILNNSLFTTLPLFFFITTFFYYSVSLCFDELNYTVLLVIVNVVMMSVCLIGIDYLRMKQDIWNYGWVFLTYILCISLSSMLGYFWGRDVFYIYMFTSIALCIPAFLSLRILSSSFEIKFNFKKKIKTYVWSLKYGIPVVCSTSIMSFLVVGDKVILGSFVSKHDLASYSIATLIASTSLFLVNNFASAWGAFLFKKIPNIARVQIKAYYFSAMKWLLLSIPAAALIYAAQMALYFYFFSENYPNLSLSIFFLTLGYCFLGVAKYFMGYLNYLNCNVLILYSALISCFLMFILPLFIFGLTVPGMSLSIFVSMFVFCFIVFIFTTREVIKYAN